MYTLRLIKGDGQVSNQSLGNNYSITQEYCSEYDKLLKKVAHPEKTRAIIVANDGKLIIPLHKDNTICFIMTETGKTFEKL